MSSHRAGRRGGRGVLEAPLPPEPSARHRVAPDRPTRALRPRRGRRTRHPSPLRSGLVLAAVAVVMTAAALATNGGGSLVFRSPSPTATPGAVEASIGTASRSPSAASSSAASSAATALPVGDLPGWHQVFREDFTTPLAAGSFPGSAYSSRWSGYEDLTDSSGHGDYETAKVTSVRDGALDIHLTSRSGRALVAAVVPRAGGGASQRYGRYVVRYRADDAPGFTVGGVLWPDSNDWSDGAVEFPSGPAGGPISGTVRCPGAPSTTCLGAGAKGTSAGWHVAAVEWRPSGTSFWLDGALVGRSATSPSAPLHWVLQTSTSGDAPAPSTSGHVLVDWVSIYARS